MNTGQRLLKKSPLRNAPGVNFSNFYIIKLELEEELHQACQLFSHYYYRTNVREEIIIHGSSQSQSIHHHSGRQQEPMEEVPTSQQNGKWGTGKHGLVKPLKSSLRVPLLTGKAHLLMHRNLYSLTICEPSVQNTQATAQCITNCRISISLFDCEISQSDISKYDNFACNPVLILNNHSLHKPQMDPQPPSSYYPQTCFSCQ